MLTDVTGRHVWKGRSPVASDETRPFWEACNEDRFVVQRCQSCGRRQYPYRGVCCHCWSDRVVDEDSQGTGTIWTFTVVMKNSTASVGLETPYVIALVELAEGVRVLGNLLGCEVEEAEIGMPVALAFAVAPSGQRVPVFVPNRAGQDSEVA
jgi:uncharacterized OB-fold protein